MLSKRFFGSKPYTGDTVTPVFDCCGERPCEAEPIDRTGLVVKPSFDNGPLVRFRLDHDLSVVKEPSLESRQQEN